MINWGRIVNETLKKTLCSGVQSKIGAIVNIAWFVKGVVWEVEEGLKERRAAPLHLHNKTGTGSNPSY
jgi:hypothetical protein